MHSVPMSSLFLGALAAMFGATSGASLAEWRSRSIYQVLTDRFALTPDTPPIYCNVKDGLYCGGSWRAIADRLDYIQGMDFDAIWISPVVKQLPQQTGDGEAYTAYWQQDLYALNSRFGDENDLKALVQAAHDRNMYVMLDIVVNHVAHFGPGTTLDVTPFNPFNDEKYFHSYCDITASNNLTNVEVCWLGDHMVSLADLRTEDQEVQDMYGEWIAGMVANYSFDGLRIDTAINVNKEFFPEFVKAAGVFATGEVLQGDDSVSCQWEKNIGSILNYPVYFPLIRAFQDTQGSINDLVQTIESVKRNCRDPTALGTFSENHDVKRFASYNPDFALAKNVIAFTVLFDGIPIIYQGQEQHMQGVVSPYTNRAPLWRAGYNTSSTLYKHIKTLNQFRRHVIHASEGYTKSLTDSIYQDYHSLALRKGSPGEQVITVLNNNGQTTDKFELPISGHGYAKGTRMMEILSCTELKVNDTGFLNVGMDQGLPRIFFPHDLMFNSSLCNMPDHSPPVSTTTFRDGVTTVVNGHTSVYETTTISLVPATPTNTEPSRTSSTSTPAESTAAARAFAPTNALSWSLGPLGSILGLLL